MTAPTTLGEALPVLATFFYERTDDGDEGCCTTALLGGEFDARRIPPKLIAALDTIKKRERVQMFRTTTRDADGNEKVTMTAVVDE